MLIKLIRWILGCVKFDLTGGFPERFVNFTVREGIAIWNIRKINDGISGKVIASDYKRLRVISKKCGSRTKLVTKYGLPFTTRRYRRRKGIIIGMAIFFISIYSLSSYIWSIGITGNSQIPSEEIISVMKDLGVSPGSLKKRINIPMVQQEAMIKLPDVAWISVNITGSYANISIKEKVKAPNIVGEDKPCDIKASMDGCIARVETYQGTSAVNEGDAVLKGQLLISGIVESLTGNSSFVHSDGKVYAYTKRKVQEVIPLTQIKAYDTGKIVKRYRLKFFEFELPFSLWYKTDETYRYEFYSNKLQIGQIPLPIVFYQEKWYEQTCNDLNLSYTEALYEANMRVNEKEKNEFKDKRIINKTVEDREENDSCILSVAYDCMEEIGVKEEIILD